MTSRTVGPLHLELAGPAAGAEPRPDILCLHGLFSAGWVFDDFLARAATRCSTGSGRRAPCRRSIA